MGRVLPEGKPCYVAHTGVMQPLHKNGKMGDCLIPHDLPIKVCSRKGEGNLIDYRKEGHSLVAIANGRLSSEVCFSVKL